MPFTRSPTVKGRLGDKEKKAPIVYLSRTNFTETSAAITRPMVDGTIAPIRP